MWNRPSRRALPVSGDAAERVRRLKNLPPDDPSQPPWTPARGPDEFGASVAARLPVGLRSGMLDPGRRGLAALTCVAIVGALLGGWFFLRAKPSAAEGAAYTPGSSASGSEPSGAAGSLPPLPSEWATLEPAGSPVIDQVVVDVVGRVRHPGVFEVDVGSRIDDLITVAGGPLPGTDLTGLDLAAKVSDGDEIFVGIAPPSGAAAASAGGVVAGPAPGGPIGGPSPAALVNLNAADLTERRRCPASVRCSANGSSTGGPLMAGSGRSPNCSRSPASARRSLLRCRRG